MVVAFIENCEKLQEETGVLTNGIIDKESLMVPTVGKLSRCGGTFDDIAKEFNGLKTVFSRCGDTETE